MSNRRKSAQERLEKRLLNAAKRNAGRVSINSAQRDAYFDAHGAPKRGPLRAHPRASIHSASKRRAKAALRRQMKTLRRAVG